MPQTSKKKEDLGRIPGESGPRLSKDDRLRIAKAVTPWFLRHARRLGIGIHSEEYGSVDHIRPVAFHFLPPAPKTSKSGFSLYVTINPAVDIDSTRKNLRRIGLEGWFVKTFCDQYKGMQKISWDEKRVGDGLLEWIDELCRIHGKELLDILTLASCRDGVVDDKNYPVELKKWRKRLAKFGMKIEDLRISRDAGIKITATLLEDIQYNRSEDLLEWLRKRMQRRMPPRKHVG